MALDRKTIRIFLYNLAVISEIDDSTDDFNFIANKQACKMFNYYYYYYFVLFHYQE